MWHWVSPYISFPNSYFDQGLHLHWPLVLHIDPYWVYIPTYAVKGYNKVVIKENGFQWLKLQNPSKL